MNKKIMKKKAKKILFTGMKILGTAIFSGLMTAGLNAIFNQDKGIDVDNITDMSDDQLNMFREKIRPISISSEVSTKEANEALHIRDMIDNELSKRAWGGQEIGYPVHSDGGWYLDSNE